MLRIPDSVSDGRFDLVQSPLRLMPEIGRLSATFSRLAAYETVRERPYYADGCAPCPARAAASSVRSSSAMSDGELRSGAWLRLIFVFVRGPGCRFQFSAPAGLVMAGTI